MAGQTGNQQPKVSDTDRAWLAGFFDGEGTATLSVRAKAGKNLGPKVQALVMLQATDLPSFENVTRILRAAHLAHYVGWSNRVGFTKAGKPWRKAWSVRFAGHRRCRAVLYWLMPHLHTKRLVAEVVLRYIETRQQHSDFRTPITAAELQMVHEVRQINGTKRPYQIKLNVERPGASHDKLAANGRKGAAVRWGNRPSLGSETTR